MRTRSLALARFGRRGAGAIVVAVLTLAQGLLGTVTALPAQAEVPARCSGVSPTTFDQECYLAQRPGARVFVGQLLFADGRAAANADTTYRPTIGFFCEPSNWLGNDSTNPTGPCSHPWDATRYSNGVFVLDGGPTDTETMIAYGGVYTADGNAWRDNGWGTQPADYPFPTGYFSNGITVPVNDPALQGIGFFPGHETYLPGPPLLKRTLYTDYIVCSAVDPSVPRMRCVVDVTNNRPPTTYEWTGPNGAVSTAEAFEFVGVPGTDARVAVKVKGAFGWTAADDTVVPILACGDRDCLRVSADSQTPPKFARGGTGTFRLQLSNLTTTELTDLKVHLDAGTSTVTGGDTLVPTLGASTATETTYQVAVDPAEAGEFLTVTGTVTGTFSGRAITQPVSLQLNLEQPSSLRASIAATVPTGGVRQGETFEVRVTATNAGDTDLTDVGATELAKASGDATFEIVDGPTPTSQATVTPQGSATFVYHLKLTKARPLQLRARVTATSADSSPLTADAATDVEVLESALRVEFVNPPASFTPGVARDLHARITNLTARPLTGVAFAAERVSGSELDPSTGLPSSTVDIAANDVQDLTFPVKLTKGAATFTIRFTAESSDPAVPKESVEQTFDVVENLLNVTIEPVAPAKLDVTLDEDAEAKPIGKKIPLTLIVENTTNAPIDNVTLQGPLSFVARTTPKPVPFDIDTTTPPRDGPLLGTLSAHEKRRIALEITVGDELDADMRQLVTYADPATNGTGRALGSTRVKATKKTILYYHVDLPDDLKANPRVDDGGSFQVFATVSNRSTTKSINVSSLIGRTNTPGIGCGKLVPLADSLNTLTAKCPVPWSGTLDPGETKELHGLVHTLVADTRRARIQYGYEATVVDPSKPEGEQETPIDPANVTIPDGGDRFEMSVIGSINEPIPPTVAGTSLAFGRGALTGIFDFFVSNAESFLSLPRLLGELAVFNLTLPYNLSVQMTKAGKYLAETKQAIDALPADQRTSLFDRVSQEAWQYADQKKTTFDQFRKKVNDDIAAYLTGVFTSYYQGDTDALADSLGYSVGRIGPEVFLCLMPEIEAGKVLEAGYAARQAVLSKLPLGSIKTVALGRAIKTNETIAWGMSALESAFLQARSKATGYIYVFRSRDARSIERIAAGAYEKAEFIKTKNVSKWEKYLFGWSDAQFAEHEATVVIKKLYPEDLQRALAKAESDFTGDALREAKESITSRYEARVEDYKKSLGQYEQWAAESEAGKPLEYSFNFKDNQITDDVAGEKITKYYDMKLEPIPGDADTFVMKLRERKKLPSGELLEADRPFAAVTGDLDGLDIFKVNGDPLTYEEYAAELRALASSPLRIQHPFSADFRIADKRIGNFNDFFGPNGERLLQIAPDNIRAVTISKEHSKFLEGRKAHVEYLFGFRTDAKIAQTGSVTLAPGLTWENWIGNAGLAVNGISLAQPGPPAAPKQVKVSVRTASGTKEIFVNSHDGFKVGDTITINPGKPNQETATIVAFGSFILDRPLAFDHDVNEPIVLAQAGPATPPPATPAAGPTPSTVAPVAVPATAAPSGASSPSANASSAAVPTTIPTTVLAETLANGLPTAPPANTPTTNNGGTAAPAQPVAYTGSRTADYLRWAFGMIAAGAVTLLQARRRRRTTIR